MFANKKSERPTAQGKGQKGSTMTYPNLHAAVRLLSRKLHTFAGHSIDPCHQSYCFDKLARAIDHINGEAAAKSVNFDGEIYSEGNAIPVVVTVTGTAIDSPVDVAIQLA